MTAGAGMSGASEFGVGNAKYAVVNSYSGNSSANVVSSGQALNGGGLVWVKSRGAAFDHRLFDTARGATKYLSTSTDAAEVTDADTLTVFSGDGFILDGDNTVNGSGSGLYGYFSFIEKGGAFDIVTYTGNGTSQSIAHGLGVIPGLILVKATSATGDWAIYHRAADASAPQDYGLSFSAGGVTDSTGYWNDTAPTASQFTVGSGVDTNAAGVSYVAYVFAQEPFFSYAGSYVGNGSANGPVAQLGWNPIFVLIVRRSTGQNWFMFSSQFDSVNPNTRSLLANSDAAEVSGSTYQIDHLPNGFQIRTLHPDLNANGETYLYMAWRAQQ